MRRSIADVMTDLEKKIASLWRPPYTQSYLGFIGHLSKTRNI
jgi:hypothetical protein